MAELSDTDKQILLGKDYKAKMLERDTATGVTDATRDAKSKADMLSNIMVTALGVGAVALLIFGTNFYSVSGPYNSTLSIGSAMVAIASIAIAAYARSKRAS
ncbi:MAG: hypothetical protein Q8M31_19185 [Beijerinckiaceae bacterium]|nr:hypothetical protein [Beijerinckiaceae bacterium]